MNHPDEPRCARRDVLEQTAPSASSPSPGTVINDHADNQAGATLVDARRAHLRPLRLRPGKDGVFPW